MAATETLTAKLRTEQGSSACRRLRLQGYLPAIMYGKNKPLNLTLTTHQAEQVFKSIRGSERLVSLKVEDTKNAAKEYQVLVRQVHTSPLRQKLLHVDFHQIDLSSRVKVLVEVLPVGKAAGEVHGGLLQTVMHEVLLECLPTNIPEKIEVDISPLNVGESIHVADLQLPENVIASNDKDDTVMVLQAPRILADAEEDLAKETEALDETSEEKDTEEK